MNNKTILIAGLGAAALATAVYLTRIGSGESSNSKVSRGAVSTVDEHDALQDVQLAPIERTGLSNADDQDKASTVESKPPQPHIPFASVDPTFSIEKKIDMLMNARDAYLKTCEVWTGGRPIEELSFVRRCAVTILREQGRADYGDPEQLARDGGFKLHPLPNQHVIAADLAKYTLAIGELPAYDLAYDRVYSFDDSVQPPSGTQQSQYELIFEEALRSLGVDSLDGSKE